MEETTGKSGLSTGAIVGIAVIIALVFGGGAYAIANSKATKEKNDLNAQITELQNQVASATTAVATTSSTATSATTDATANWKTYTSDAYGVTFKYPSDWILKEDASNSCQSFASITSPATKAEFDKLSAENKGDLPISAQDISFSYCKTVQDADGNNPKKWTSFSDMINDKGYYHDQTKINFAGQTAYSVIEGGLLDYYTILMERSGHIYRIGFGNRDSKAKVSTTENQILSSFQFTK